MIFKSRSGPTAAINRSRHTAGIALVYRAHRRQEARPAQHHQPPAQSGSLQAPRPPRHHAAQTAAGAWLHGTGPAVAAHPDTVL